MNNNLFMKHWKIRIGMKDQYFEVNTWTDVCLTVLAQWVAQLWSSLAQEFQSDLDEGYGTKGMGYGPLTIYQESLRMFVIDPWVSPVQDL